jgi:tRNA pseudouridine38-40 synthase
VPRYRLTIEYHGGGFAGFQWQEHQTTVQGCLEDAFKTFTGQAIRVYCAGRTDAGVHAAGQMVHVDLAPPREPQVIENALNHLMRPAKVAVVHAALARPDFDARRSAINRAYRFRILNRRAPPTMESGLVWHVGTPLDANAMQEAAQMLVGHHDFSSFRASGCQAKSPVKTLDRLDVTQHGEEIWIEAQARSFLHNQIRIFAGTLKQVGAGYWPPEQVAIALAAKNREAAGITAPATGLCLLSVGYPPEMLLGPEAVALP